MTVDEVIAVLQQYVDNGFGDYQVIKSADDEGNYFSNIEQITDQYADVRCRHIELVDASDATVMDRPVVCIW